MATKLDDTCLEKASDDEPIFVLRAQDISSPHVIHFWLSLNPGIPEEKKREALRCASAMLKWPKKKKAD